MNTATTTASDQATLATVAGEGTGVSTATCDIRFSLQNRYAGNRLAKALTRIGLSNRAVTLSGRATKSEKTISEGDFVGAKDAAICETLTTFLAEYELPRADDLVILDMEPQGFAPRALGEFEGPRQGALIDAYRRRIGVARQVLQDTGLPGVQLGMYQVIVPDGKGRFSDEFEQRMCGYLEAGRQGMYDELDFICPVLYQRFGPDDANPERVREWTAAATRQAIEQSLTLTRTDGAPIPLVPIISFWVFNRGSANYRQAVSPESVANQLQIVQAATGVAAILFWSGSETRHEMKTAPKPVEPININQFLRDVGTLPWPGCS